MKRHPFIENKIVVPQSNLSERSRPQLSWSSASPQRIAIIRALQLGDLLVSVPAWRALRQRFPSAEITLIGLPWAKTFAWRYRRYIDRFVEFPGYPGIAELPVDPIRTQQFLTEQRAYNYDLVIQMHGSGRTSNPLALDLQGAITVGYYEQELPSGMTLGRRYPQEQPEIWRNLGLAELVGCVDLDPHLEFPLFEDDYHNLAALPGLFNSGEKPWIALHPGSRSPARRWPPAYFAVVADELARRFGAQILLTGSPDELPTVQQVSAKMKTPALNLVGKTSLGALGALISQLDLFISNDTGPAHIACAFPIPSITLFGPAEFQRWAPLERKFHAALRYSVSCSPCGFWECPIDHRCLHGLRPAHVLDVAEQFLSRGIPGPAQVGSAEMNAG